MLSQIVQRVGCLFLLLGGINGCSEEERHFLPESHWMYPRLEAIFASEEVLQSVEAFTEAGFTILYHQRSGMKVARHPLLPGHLVKVYLAESQYGGGKQWALTRCEGAESVRKLVAEKNLRYFTAPEKWVYFVSYPNIPVLVVQDMDLVAYKNTKKAWKRATKRQMQELYVILSHGLASCALCGNIPYTKQGNFACVDTAYPPRNYSYASIRKYFSSQGKRYWEQILEEAQ